MQFIQFNLHNNIDILAYLHLKYKFIPLTLMILLTKLLFTFNQYSSYAFVLVYNNSNCINSQGTQYVCKLLLPAGIALQIYCLLYVNFLQLRFSL